MTSAGAPTSAPATRADRIEARAHHRRRLLLVMLCTASFAVVLDNTVLAVAIPTISRELRTSPSELNWIIDSYTLVFAGLLIAGGAFADRIGRRAAFRIGISTFGLGSLAAALSETPVPLIASRAFMGLGAAILMPAALSTLMTIFPPEERVFAIGVWSASAAVASVTGPVVGGLLLAEFSWGSIFLINMPVVVVMLVATFALIPAGKSANPPPIDGLGTVLSIAALSGFLYAIIAAPEHGWTSTTTFAGAAIGMLALVVLIRHLRAAPDPMIDPSIFRNPRMTGATIALTCFMFGSFSALYARAQFFQFILGYTALESGLTATPVPIASIIVAPTVGILVRRLGYRTPVVVGFLLMAVGTALVSLLDESATTGDIAWRLVVFGIGAGITAAPLSQTIIATFAARRAGVASGLNDTARQVGGAVGIAVSGSVIASIYAHRFADDPASGSLHGGGAESARHSVAAALQFARSLPPRSGTALVDGSRDAWVHGFRWGMVVAAGLLVCGSLIAAITMPPRREAGPRGRVDET